MAGEVLLHLPFGLDHEPKAPAVTGPAREQAEAECTGIPQWIEQARAGAELVETALGPRQVIHFFGSSALHLVAQLYRSCSQRLRLVERLSAHLADVIDTQQSTREPSLLGGELRIVGRRLRASRVGTTGQGAQRFVSGGDPVVKGHEAQLIGIPGAGFPGVLVHLPHRAAGFCFALLPDNSAVKFASQAFASARALWCNSRSFR